MKNSKLIYCLAFMLMLISIGGVSAIDDGDVAISDVGSSDDVLNDQTIAASEQSFENDALASGDRDNTAQTWVIDNDNYANYFVADNESEDDIAGTIRDDAPIKDGDILKLSNLEGKVFNINKSLTITSNSSADVLHNCMIKLYKGADNSIIYGLNITVDTDAKNYTGADNLPLWPILAIQVSNITIKDNYIRNNATNSHALGLGDVFHSTIYNNTLISGSHPFYLLGCDNLISHNYINAGTVPGVNGIPYVFYITRILGHSMATWYRNPQNGTISNNIIEYNTIDGSGSGWLVYGNGLSATSTSNNTFRYNNIINGNIAFQVQNAINYKVYGNNITNVSNGINAIQNTIDWEVYNNYINAKFIGIIVDFEDKVYNNTIIVNSSSTATGIQFNNAKVNGTFISNNNITLIGVDSKGIDMSAAKDINGITIEGNNINVLAIKGSSIGIFGGKDAQNNKMTYNNLKITNNNINVKSENISANTVGIELHPVNNSVISNNIIDAKNGLGIYAYSGTSNSGKTPLTNLTISSNKINGRFGIKIGNSYKNTKSNNITGVSIFDNIINSTAVAIDISSIDKISNTSILKNDIIVNAINDSNAYAIFSKTVQNLIINENTIKFTANTNGTVTQYAISLSEIENLIFKDNKLDANLKSLLVHYDPITLASNYTNLGLYLVDSNNIVIKGNKFNVIDTVQGEGSDNLCNIYLKDNTNVSFNSNDVSILASANAYVMKVEGYKGHFNLMINNKITGRSNSIYGIGLYGCKDVTLLTNKINLEGNYTIGIATSSDLTEIICNEIVTKGLALGNATSGEEFISDNIGIYANAHANRVFISCNNIDSSKYGILSDSKEANIIENVINIVGIPGKDAIGVKTSTKTNFIGNTIVAKCKQNCCELGLPINTITGILATNNAKIIAFNNKINTNGNYTINLTESCKEGFSQNTIYNNNLIANKLVGDDSVTFDKGCEDNNLISNNTPLIVVITASNVVKTYGNANKLVATIKDNKGNAIVNQKVTITIGKSTYTVTTNNNGIISLAIKQAVGTYTAYIKVSGEKYVTATKKVSIKVNKVYTSVKANKVAAKVKKAKYFQVFIKNKVTKKVISKLSIIIKVSNGKKYKTYKVKTNSKGIAKISTKGLTKGAHKVIISSANKNYHVSKIGKLIVIKK